MESSSSTRDYVCVLGSCREFGINHVRGSEVDMNITPCISWDYSRPFSLSPNELWRAALPEHLLATRSKTWLSLRVQHPKSPHSSIPLWGGVSKLQGTSRCIKLPGFILLPTGCIASRRDPLFRWEGEFLYTPTHTLTRYSEP